MKYPAETYAEAFRQSVEVAPEKEKSATVKRFVRLLEKNGDISRAEKITAAVEKLMVKAKGGRWATLEFARPIEPKVKRRITNIFSSRDKIEEKINTALIAGVRVTLDGEKEFDNSLQRKLKKLFGD